MPATADRPATREEKLRRYAELNAFSFFLGDLQYLFEGVLPDDVLALVHPDELRVPELDALFEELWPEDEDIDDRVSRDLGDRDTILAARLHVRAAGNAEWFARMADMRLGGGES